MGVRPSRICQGGARQGRGLEAARPAETIPVGAVARSTERTIPIAECLRGGADGCRIAPACRQRAVLDEAEDAFFAVLDRYSVRDLVDRNPELRGSASNLSVSSLQRRRVQPIRGPRADCHLSEDEFLPDHT